MNAASNRRSFTPNTVSNRPHQSTATTRSSAVTLYSANQNPCNNKSHARALDADEHPQIPKPDVGNNHGAFADQQREAISLEEWPTKRRQLYQMMKSRHAYVFDVCAALMMYGAPTHRLEEYLQLTSQALDVSCESCHLPGYMFVSVGNAAEESMDTRIIHREQSLNIAKLYDVHDVYKAVIDKRMTVESAISRLDDIVSHPGKFPPWFRVLMYGLASASSGAVSYNAQPVDLPIIFLLGTLVGGADLVLAPRSKLSGHIVQVCAAILSSCIGRGFGSIHWGHDRRFCFSAISQASISMTLPGFTITNGALELESKNIISGAVGMVYGIVYTLFLSFGFTIGMTIYGAIDHNATSDTKCDTSYGFWWHLAFVLPFTFGYIIVSQGKWRKMPAMLAVSLAGWCVTYFSGRRMAAVPAISQALGALTVGVLANLYSRFVDDLAVTIMHPGIYIQVPGSLAASGSLISGLASADLLIHPAKNSTAGNDTLSNSQPSASELDAGYAMVKIAVAITVGLSISVLLVYPFWKTRSRGGIFSL